MMREAAHAENGCTMPLPHGLFEPEMTWMGRQGKEQDENSVLTSNNQAVTSSQETRELLPEQIRSFLRFYKRSMSEQVSTRCTLSQCPQKRVRYHVDEATGPRG